MEKIQIITYIIGCIGALSNGMVLLVIGKSKLLRKKLVNQYFANQSGIDLCASVMLIVSYLDINPDYSKPTGDFICKIWTSRVLLWSLLMSSTYNLVITSLDRYVQIVHPIWHKNVITDCKVRLMFVAAWLSGFVWNVPMIISTTGIRNSECVGVGLWPNVQIQHGVGILGIILQYFIPLGVLIFSYTRILMILKKKRNVTNLIVVQNSQGQGQVHEKGQQNVIKTLVMVSVAFVACFTMNQMLFLYHNLGGYLDFTSFMYHASVILVFLNCCINPFVYMIKYKHFRKGLADIFNRNNQVSVQMDDTTESRM